MTDAWSDCLVRWTVYAALLGGAFELVLVHRATAQLAEREHQTRQWTITVPESTWDPGATIHVIDTAGVCLYEVNDRAIAAVPKTQLPPGTGCQ